VDEEGDLSTAKATPTTTKDNPANLTSLGIPSTKDRKERWIDEKFFIV
jgi:hypothetical protein